MVCKRLFKIINLHGVKYQFGSSPGVGCQEGLFTLKTALHARHNHNLHTFVSFVDLFKAFDTVDHGIIIGILKRYGEPTTLRSAIPRMYADLKIVFKIGKVKAEMKQRIGVRQGDCMVTVLFFFMMIAFAEKLKKEWEKSRLEMTTFHQRTHSPRDKGSLNGHKKNTFSKGTLLELFSVLYVDDVAFPFGNTSQLEQVFELIYSHFTEFGLEMHIGREGKPLKTECVFHPPSGFFRGRQKIPASNEGTGNNITKKQKERSESQEKKYRREDG